MRRGVPVDIHAHHLDLKSVRAGDVVAGTLPASTAKAIFGRGATYAALGI